MHPRHPAHQLTLFEAITDAYQADPDRPLAQNDLYAQLVQAGQLDAAQLQARHPVGRAKAPVSLARRAVRWHQQSLRAMNIIERVPERRGVWRLTEGAAAKARAAKPELTMAPPRVAMLAVDTELGAAVWGACQTAFAGLTDEVAVVITSPPYPVRAGRAYGTIDAQRWLDFICRALEPLVRRLLPGGSIAINIGNDVFEPKSPARSIYQERFVIAMVERLGLHKLDQVIWRNPCRPPGPIQWASLRRMQLGATYESVWVFTNDPLACFADNRRVLQPHSVTHKQLIARGGERRRRTSGDGAHRVLEGAYAAETEGRIPRNVLDIRHNCPSQQRMRAAARAVGLPDHGASMPLSLADFLVRWLSRPGDLVVDPFGGTLTTAEACELNGRRWLASEMCLEYLMSGRLRLELLREPHPSSPYKQARRSSSASADFVYA